MDELAITTEPIRKRAKISNKCDVPIENATSFPATGITSLPVEIIFEIFSYLPCKDLYSVRAVSMYFRRIVDDPCLWKTYEVTNNEVDAPVVIKELKRMTFLRKFSINGRADCDDILRQLSLTNQNLEELYVCNCTGSTSKLYLRSGYLIRILERCRKLHTIKIFGSKFRGRKFYQLLGDIGQRLKAVCMPATSWQFCTFIKHARQIGENDREMICSMCIGAKRWSPLYYFVTRQEALISYLHNNVVWIQANRSAHKMSRIE